MLVRALPDTYLILEVEHLGTMYRVLPREGLAHVPAELGMVLERSRLTRIVDRDADPPWLGGEDKWAAWVSPPWPATRH
jgi:hypothetical protein